MRGGIGASEGIGIGQVVIIEEQEVKVERRTISDADAEIARLNEAMDHFEEVTNQMADKMAETVGEQDADILRGHVIMLRDPMVGDQVNAMIRGEMVNAEVALDQSLDQMAEMFRSIPDELIQQRATDLMDIKSRMLKILNGIEEVDISAVPEGTVLVAKKSSKKRNSK